MTCIFTSINVFWKNINIYLLQLKSLAKKIKPLLYFSLTSVLWCMRLETRNICIASSHSLQFDAITLKTKTRHFQCEILNSVVLFRALLRRNKETVNWLFCETDLPCLFMKNVYALHVTKKRKPKPRSVFVHPTS